MSCHDGLQLIPPRLRTRPQSRGAGCCDPRRRSIGAVEWHAVPQCDIEREHRSRGDQPREFRTRRCPVKAARPPPTRRTGPGRRCIWQHRGRAPCGSLSDGALDDAQPRAPTPQETAGRPPRVMVRRWPREPSGATGTSGCSGAARPSVNWARKSACSPSRSWPSIRCTPRPSKWACSRQRRPPPFSSSGSLPASGWIACAAVAS